MSQAVLGSTDIRALYVMISVGQRDAAPLCERKLLGERWVSVGERIWVSGG